MSIRIDVWSDFVCPWCFLVFASLEKLKESYLVKVYWRSFELRPAGSPPIPLEYLKHIERTRPRFEALARQQYGIEIRSGPFGIISHAALIGAKVAEDHQGPETSYHSAVLRAYWQYGADISDEAALVDLAVSVGLDRETFVAALHNPLYEMQVSHDIVLAQRYGFTGVPALILANKYALSGAQPYEALAEIVEELMAGAGTK